MAYPEVVVALGDENANQTGIAGNPLHVQVGALPLPAGGATEATLTNVLLDLQNKADLAVV
jgi:uncharacterized membrane protein